MNNLANDHFDHYTVEQYYVVVEMVVNIVVFRFKTE